MLSPDKVFPDIFRDVQMAGIFEDSKTFADATPKKSVAVINQAYENRELKNEVSLRKFVEENFVLPQIKSTAFKADLERPLEEHIQLLWGVLKRKSDKPVEGGSLIPLPYPYIVPGGRFGEIYYWDSYFTMLGLQVCGESGMIRDMVRNFAYLIDEIGYIPNGNRTYFLGRSQPPFFSLMVELLSEIEGPEVFTSYFPQLEKEYSFWMNPAGGRLVELEGGTLNRYWDNIPEPRPESYREDVEMAEKGNEDHSKTFRHLRAACESGWDFTARWFRKEKDFKTVSTADIIPVDLNALLYNLEKVLAKAASQIGRSEKADSYLQATNRRKALINEYCWDEQKEFFGDYSHVDNSPTLVWSLAGVFPLYFGIASETQAASIADVLEDKFLKPGGLVSTTVSSGQQWDAPNGWAPLQWMAIKGLGRYGFNDLANVIASRWIALNKKVYANTGKMVEKYNVVDMNLLAGGGEYPVQDGFGWSNGVLIRLLKEGY